MLRTIVSQRTFISFSAWITKQQDFAFALNISTFSSSAAQTVMSFSLLIFCRVNKQEGEDSYWAAAAETAVTMFGQETKAQCGWLQKHKLHLQITSKKEKSKEGDVTVQPTMFDWHSERFISWESTDTQQKMQQYRLHTSAKAEQSSKWIYVHNRRQYL